MTKLSRNINIFGDDDVVKFLRLELEVPHLLSNLRDQYEFNRLGKTEPLLSENQSGHGGANSTQARRGPDQKGMFPMMAEGP